MELHSIKTKKKKPLKPEFCPVVGQYSQDWSGRCSWASGRSLRLTSSIGQWKCFVMVFTFFFPAQVFQPFFQVQPICAPYLLAEAVFTFLVPCLIFSISSPHFFCLQSHSFLLRFPAFSPVSSSFPSLANLFIHCHFLNPNPKF